jgi:hypothetical protein
MFSKPTIPGLQGTSKLLARSFDEGIIRARWFVGFVTWKLNPIQVLSNVDEDGSSCRPGILMWTDRIHEFQYRVTKVGDKKEIGERLLQRKPL